MKHKFLLLYSWFVRTLLFFFPDMPLFMRFRGLLYGFGMKHCGSNFQVTHNAILRCLENMEVGMDVYFANNVLILATASLTIGDEVMLGPNVVIVNGNHKFYGYSFRFKSGRHLPVRIGFGAWVGANAVIAAGAELPASSMLAANSFLNKSFSEQGIIMGGLPARMIGRIEKC